MRYISLDIETTGLDPIANQILEIGIVFDNLQEEDSIKGTLDVDSLESVRIVVIPSNDYIVGDIVALDMNADLIKEIAEYKKYGSKKENTIYCEIDNVLDRISDRLKSFGYDPKNVTVAGKNPNFDIGFMEMLNGYGTFVKFHRRVLDPSFFFVQGSDTEIPNLKECLRRIGKKPRELHTAVGDARDVVDLVRYAFNNKLLPLTISPEHQKRIRESATEIREASQVDKNNMIGINTPLVQWGDPEGFRGSDY